MVNKSQISSILHPIATWPYTYIPLHKVLSIQRRLQNGRARGEPVRVRPQAENKAQYCNVEVIERMS